MKIPFVKIPWNVKVSKFLPIGISSGIDVGFSNWGLELINVSLYVLLISCMFLLVFEFILFCVFRYTMTKSTSIIFVLVNALILRLEKAVS